MTYMEQANAKVNLFLDIGDLRLDGYHDLVSIMFNTDLHDLLTFSVSESGHKLETPFGPYYFEFRQGSTLEVHEDSLDMELDNWSVVRVLHLYLDLCVKHDRKPRFPYNTITLERHIPAQAGLGGASSDAAALLRVIMKEDLETGRELEEVMVSIGADVPFSYFGRMALAMGRGEVLEPLSYDLGKFPMIMVKPDLAVSTAEAFQRYDTAIHQGRQFRRSDVQGVRAALESGKLGALRYLAKNTFVELLDSSSQKTVSDIISTLYELGALYANMTGSGPTCFAFFEDDAQRDRAYRDLEASFGPNIWLRATHALN